MTKAFLKITGFCAACSLLAASAWAQAEPQGQPSSDAPATRSWSTKHLSATGRDGDHSVRATELSGSAVNDSSGKRVATLEDTIINSASGRVDFALLSLADAASASNKLVPVPWSLLKTSASSSQYATRAEKPAFTLKNVDQKKLDAAPSVNASDLNQSEWQQRIYAYYGVTPGAPMGGAESPSGEMKGGGAHKMETPAPQPPIVHP
jgi:sporulation protein YlmC with PRC-barrel domain